MDTSLEICKREFFTAASGERRSESSCVREESARILGPGSVDLCADEAF
jgi:hypothetical protein